MNSCDHISWLQISGREETSIHHADRVVKVFNQLAAAQSQYPAMICFLGRKHKMTAMRELFPHNNFKRSHRGGFVNLRLDSATIESDFPLLLLDSDPMLPIRQLIHSPACHHEDVLPTSWPSSWEHSTIDTLYGRLIFLFCDVICLFAEDFDGLPQVACLLQSWLRVRSASSLPGTVRPRVIIVAKEETDSVTHSFLDLEDLRLGLQQEDIVRRSEVFASITLMRLAETQISSLARFRRLKEVILKEADRARAVRLEERVLFSAKHIQCFLHRAVQHTALSVTEPFDFIAKSRLGNELRQDYETHVCVFLNLARRYFLSMATVNRFLASSIIMDAYPPRMHCRRFACPNYIMLICLAVFDSQRLFRSLYRQHFFRAFRKAFESDDQAVLRCSMLEETLAAQFQAVEMNLQSSALLRAEALRLDSKYLKQLRTHLTCLNCLRRRPEHVLSCGHAICDICLQILGSNLEGQELCFRVNECAICSQEVSVVGRVKPVTAGPRILSIDDGGTRGVVPLEFLRLLQDVIGPALPIQDLFDQAFGTSSGEH